jgi:hypothetical protein
VNRALRLEAIIRAYGGSASLDEILQTATSRGDKSLKHRFTNAVSELRLDMKLRTPAEALVWKRGKTPGQGTYTIFPAKAREDGEVVVLPRQIDFGAQFAHP